MYNRETTTWKSADGREILIKDLTDSHVVNILNWIKARSSQYQPGLYEFFEEEAALRRLYAFAEDKPMPTKLPDGTYGFTNIRWYQRIYNYAKLLKYNWIAKRKQNQLVKKFFKSLNLNRKKLS